MPRPRKKKSRLLEEADVPQIKARKGKGEWIDNIEDPGDDLRISKSSAKQSDQRKDEDEDDSSSTGTEDEHARLLTPNVEKKIFETLDRIRSRDPSIYDEKAVFFSDADFETNDASDCSPPKKNKPKVLLYKDQLRETLLAGGADAMLRGEEEEDMKMEKMTPVQVQQALKKDLIAAADNHDDDTTGDNFFTLKTQSKEELLRNDEDFNVFKERIEKTRRNEEADNIMSRYWKTDEELAPDDRFLRDFIINKGWLETPALQHKGEDSQGEDEHLDQVENEHLDQVDNYEREFNFRFEAEEGCQIRGHARSLKTSVRDRGTNKRKRQRLRKQERQEAEKTKRVEELKRLKNLKKQEINHRLEQLKQITGKDCSIGAVDLEKPFDVDTHDQDMELLLGEDYDDLEDTLGEEELLQTPDGCEDFPMEAQIKQPTRFSKKTAQKETENTENNQHDDENNELWFLCDDCQKPIPAGKKRFDCLTCENFTLCAKCFKVNTHPHEFEKQYVPENCVPPEDFEINKPEDTDLDALLDEYYKLDCEDTIEDLRCRFSYVDVPAENHGLTVEQIMEMSNEDLNRIAPSKRVQSGVYANVYSNPEATMRAQNMYASLKQRKLSEAQEAGKWWDKNQNWKQQEWLKQQDWEQQKWPKEKNTNRRNESKEKEESTQQDKSAITGLSEGRLASYNFSPVDHEHVQRKRRKK